MRIDVDWRSSRLSALPLMCRTTFMAVALAMLGIAGVLNAQTSQSTRTQRKPAATASAREVHRPARPRSARRVEVRARTHSSSRAKLSAARKKLTPDEVGREAGLAIREQLLHREYARVSQREYARRRVARVERGRSMRRAQVERAAWRSEGTGAARVAERNEAARTYADPETERVETYEAQRVESQRMDAAHEAMRAASPAIVHESDESADMGTAAVDRMAPREPAVERKDDVTAQDGDGTAAGVASQSDEEADRPDSARANSSDDEASLVIPRGGMPAPLFGSLASLERQNDRLEAEGLERIENEADLEARIADKLLVPIPVSSALTVNPDLEKNHRYCRPWTAKFLADLARAHEAVFHSPLEVNSAVRTVEYQKRLMETNGNAAPAEGDLVSPHLTGATIDIAKKGLSRAEIAWMRRRLAGLQAVGKIDVEEEFRQACFHITVYKSYAPARKTGPATPAKPVAHRSRRLTVDPVEQPEAQGA